MKATLPTSKSCKIHEPSMCKQYINTTVLITSSLLPLNSILSPPFNDKQICSSPELHFKIDMFFSAWQTFAIYLKDKEMNTHRHTRIYSCLCCNYPCLPVALFVFFNDGLYQIIFELFFSLAALSRTQRRKESI